MIIAVNRKTKAFIVFDTDIQDDVENTILWMASDFDADGRDVDFDFGFYLTDEITGCYKVPRIRPNRPQDKFINFIALTPDDDNDRIGFLIDSYNNFWKDKTPFKEFFQDCVKPSPVGAA